MDARNRSVNNNDATHFLLTVGQQELKRSDK